MSIAPIPPKSRVDPALQTAETKPTATPTTASAPAATSRPDQFSRAASPGTALSTFADDRGAQGWPWHRKKQPPTSSPAPIAAPQSVTPPPADPRDVLAAKMISAYGLSAIKATSRPWKLEELQAVDDAIQKMSPADREALRGVALVRSSSMAADGEAKGERDATVAGSFAWKSSEMKLGPDGKLASGGTLTLYSDAFAGITEGPDGELLNSGGRPQVDRTIFHELGHAVALRELREAFGQHNADKAAGKPSTAPTYASLSVIGKTDPDDDGKTHKVSVTDNEVTDEIKKFYAAFADKKGKIVVTPSDKYSYDNLFQAKPALGEYYAQAYAAYMTSGAMDPRAQAFFDAR